MARMQKNTRILVAVVILVAVAMLGFRFYFGPAAMEARGNQAASAVLTAFGTKLKNVSLLNDDAALNAAIEEQYGPYVTAPLLADWKTNHAHVPGRHTSSPFPDRLAVESMTTQGTSRIVNGEVILVTNDEKAGESVDTVPFVAQVVQTSAGWKIAAYQEETVQVLKKLPTSDVDIPGAK